MTKKSRLVRSVRSVILATYLVFKDNCDKCWSDDGGHCVSEMLLLQQRRRILIRNDSSKNTLCLLVPVISTTLLLKPPINTWAVKVFHFAELLRFMQWHLQDRYLRLGANKLFALWQKHVSINLGRKAHYLCWYGYTNLQWK